MHEKYEQGRGGGGAGGDIFVFVLTKTKINDDTQSGLHLEKVRKLALLVKWRCLKYTFNIQRREQKHDYAC